MMASGSTGYQGLANQSPDPPKEPNKGDPIITELLPGNKLYNGIKADFEKEGLYILTVEKVENHSLWRRYTNERDQFFQERRENDSNFELNERYLYHGTNGSKTIFTEEEIDNRLSKRGCFGNGIYFSDNPKKCAKYAEKGNEENLILLMRVILGESKVYPKGKTDRDLKREPMKDNPGRGNRFYDSVEGTPVNFREFVIYERRRALIECIIKFSRDPVVSSSSEQTQNTACSQPVPAPVEYTASGNLDASSNNEAALQDDDTDSSDTDEEDVRPIDDDTSSSDEDFCDTKDDDDNQVGEDEDTSGSSEDEYEETEGVPFTNQVDLEVLEAKIREFMTKTNECNRHVSKMFVIFENLDVISAVNQYNTVRTVQFTEQEQEEAARVTAEIEAQLNWPCRNPEKTDGLSAEDKEAIILELVEQFCQIVGLDKSSPENDVLARKYLTQTQWENDLAVLAYFEETYGI